MSDSEEKPAAQLNQTDMEDLVRRVTRHYWPEGLGENGNGDHDRRRLSANRALREIAQGSMNKSVAEFGLTKLLEVQSNSNSTGELFERALQRLRRAQWPIRGALRTIQAFANPREKRHTADAEAQALRALNYLLRVHEEDREAFDNARGEIRNAVSTLQFENFKRSNGCWDSFKKLRTLLKLHS